MPGQGGVGLKLGCVETRVFKVSSPAPRLLGLGEGGAALNGFSQGKDLLLVSPSCERRKAP